MQATNVPTGVGEQDFLLLADNAPVMMWRARPDKQCDWFNKPWLDFTGRAMDQEIGAGWADGVHPEDRDRCLATFHGAFDRREGFSMEYRLRRHDGAFRCVLDTGQPYYAPDGEFRGYFGSCIDIHDRRQGELKLKALLREVQHRVRNNMQIVIGFINLIARHSTAKQELSDLAARVRALAAIQQFFHQHEDQITQLDLSELLREVAPQLLGTLDDHFDVEVEGAGVSVDVGQATSLALTVFEALLNACGDTKSVEPKRVHIAIARANGSGAVRIELSGDACEPPASDSLSALLMHQYAHFVNGQLDVADADAGSRIALIFPM